MASASTTPNLNLPQWVGTEKPERTDFNAAFAAIDGLTRLIVDHTLASNVQTITFSDLDINTHKSYTIELDLLHENNKNASRVYMLVNGDTTLTNYVAQLLVSTGSGTNSYKFDDASIAETMPHTTLTGQGSTIATIRLGLRNGIARATSSCCMLDAVTDPVQLRNYAWIHKPSISNITSLTFSVPSGKTMQIGDKIRIYRGDV